MEKTINQSVSKYKSGAEKFLPPNLQGAFEKAVLGGMKLMYSEPMQDMIKQLLSTDSPVEKKVAEGVSGLMGVLMSRSKPSFPKELIFPVAIELLYEGVSFLNDAGQIEPLSEDQMRTAVQATVALLATKMGAKPNQVRDVLMGKAPQQPAQMPPQAPQMPQGGQPPIMGMMGEGQ